jgi:hypothetical protein
VLPGFAFVQFNGLKVYPPDCRCSREKNQPLQLKHISCFGCDDVLKVFDEAKARCLILVVRM